MSKRNFIKWSQIVLSVGVKALENTPLAPIAQKVGEAILDAEKVPGSKGVDKLRYVVDAAVAASTAAHKLGAKVSPAVVEAVGAGAISTAVNVSNIVHDAAESQEAAIAPPAAAPPTPPAGIPEPPPPAADEA